MIICMYSSKAMQSLRKLRSGHRISSKNGVSPVVSVALLLVVSVISVVGFSNWFSEFSSGVFVDVESNSGKDSIVLVEGIINDKLYLNSGGSEEVLELKMLKIVSSEGEEECSFSGNDTVSDLGLVGLWTFDEYLNNGTHNYTPDSSGNDNHGFITSYNRQPTIVKSDFGNAFYFDGVDDYVSIPKLKLTEDLSLFVKFKRGKIDYVHADALFGGWYYSGDSQLREGFDLRFYQHHPTLIELIVDYENSSGYVIEKSRQYNFSFDELNKWQNVVGTNNFLTGTQSLYIGGDLKTSKVNEPNSNIVELNMYSDMWIGNSRVNEGYFNGEIDEVRIYNRTLSSYEVEQLNWHSINSKVVGIKEIDVSFCNLDVGNVYSVFGVSEDGKVVEAEIIAK